MAKTVTCIVILIIKFLLIFNSVQCNSDVHSMLDTLDEMLLGSQTLRYSRNIDEASQIWQEYEFGTGVGNRDEIIVTNISVREDTGLPEGVWNWQFSEENGVGYLVGANETILSFVTLHRDNGSIANRVFLKVDGKILTFKLLGSLDPTSSAVVVVLCVESDFGTNLSWYRRSKENLESFWSWPVTKRVERLEFFRHGGRYKLLLMNEAKKYHGKLYSSIDVYGFNVSNEFTDFWLCQRLPVLKTYDFQICPIYETVNLIMQGENNVLLYEFEEGATKEGLFKQLQRVPSNGLRNAICFESGYMQYLAISGAEAGLYNFYGNEFIYDVRSEMLFDEFGELLWIRDIPIDTYRDESLLLVQLKNSSVAVLAWQGEEFKRIFVPMINIDDFDLSKVTAIPKFGFIFGNKIVKVESRMRDLPRPIRDEMEMMLEMKNSLEEVMQKQELIINETERRIGHSHLINPMITGFWNLSEVNADNATLNDGVTYDTITIGSQNFTSEEFQFDFSAGNEKLIELNEIMEEIDRHLSDSVPANSSEVNLIDAIEISGNLEIKGTLKVNNLTFVSLNGIPLEELLEDYIRYDFDGVIEGLKLFPSIESEAVNVLAINGIPLNDIVFESIKRNYEDIDFSKLNRLEVEGNLNFTNVNDVNWQELMKKIVLKNYFTLINGTTIVEGDVIADYFKLDNFNGLRYPVDYMMQNDTESVYMTGSKTFETLTVANLVEVETINGIPFEDFVILDENQTLTREITFENLTVDECLQIDGKLTGPKIDELKPTVKPHLKESRNVTTDIEFTNLHVVGNILVRNSVNKKSWSDFDDLLQSDEEEAEITGEKRFLGDVKINRKYTIESGKINGHRIQDFFTLNTDQELPNLQKISANVTFGELTDSDTKNLENILSGTIDENGEKKCFEKTIVFNEPLTVSELSFDVMNGNILQANFIKMLNQIYARVYFQNLTVKKLLTNTLIPANVNGVNIYDFKNSRVTLSTPQILTGDFVIENLNVSTLDVGTINGMPVRDLSDLIIRFKSVFEGIFNGTIRLHKLSVIGNVEAAMINGELFEDLIAFDNSRNVIFEKDISIENLTVYGFINGVNFSDYISDAILKTDRNIVVTGLKTFDQITCQILRTPLLNGHSVDAIWDSEKDQNFTGTLVVKGSIAVKNHFGSSGSINDIPYKDFVDRFEYLGNNTYVLHGDLRFINEVEIKDLKVNGTIQGIIFDKFLDTIIFPGEEEVVVSGAKVFLGPVIFKSDLIISEYYNGVDLKEFYEKAVFIDEPMRILTEVIFEDDIIIHEDLVVTEKLETNTVMGVDVDEMKGSAVYLNRSSYIPGSIKFLDAVFQSDLTIEKLNKFDMNLLIPLHTNQIITWPLKCTDITVRNLGIGGYVNGYNLDSIYADTFMLTGDQEITGNITFRGKVHTRQDFDARFINGIETTALVRLDGNDTLIGNFIFDEPLVINGSLRILGLLDDINPIAWQGVAITKSFPTKQIVSGNWIVHGNVDFKRNVIGNSLLNGINVRSLSDELEKRNLETGLILSNMKLDLESMCQDLKILQKYAENQIYKFNYFEYQQIFLFDQLIISVHHFEMDNLDYLLVNFESCALDAFVFDGREFTRVASISNFGLVDRWFTLTYENDIYFLTLGKTACDKGAGNLWKLEKEELTHVWDLGNVTDAKKISDASFLLLMDRKLERWSIEQIRQRSFTAAASFPLGDEKARFISHSNKILLASDSRIYEFDVQYMNRTTLSDNFGGGEILAFRTGIFQRERFLHYDETVSQDYAFIYNNDLSQKQVLQMIESHRPISFSVINFDGYVENLLIFIENGRKLKVYDYRGIQGFVYRESIKMRADKLFDFEMRKYPKLARKHCLGVTHGNRLTILEAKMLGERLDMEKLSCNN